MNNVQENKSVIELTKLSDREYKLISQLVYEKSGINLGEQKRALIAGRLNKVLRQNGFDSFQQYYDHISNDPTGTSLTTLIDRISTNHTFFNRENDHFEFFSTKAVPHMVEMMKGRSKKEMRIWCAGCSSGEEPYTLAMLLLEYFGREASFWDLGILATDISTHALDKAMAGVYYPENVNKLPTKLKSKYFKQVAGGNWAVTDKIKSMVLYRKLNLMREEYPFKSKFQSIFCRNVMIYFDKPTRKALVDRFARYTDNTGYLFIGHSETLGRDDLSYRYIRPAVYQKDGSNG